MIEKNVGERGEREKAGGKTRGEGTKHGTRIDGTKKKKMIIIIIIIIILILIIIMIMKKRGFSSRNGEQAKKYDIQIHIRSQYPSNVYRECVVVEVCEEIRMRE